MSAPLTDDELARWAKWADPDGGTVHPDLRCPWWVMRYLLRLHLDECARRRAAKGAA